MLRLKGRANRTIRRVAIGRSRRSAIGRSRRCVILRPTRRSQISRSAIRPRCRETIRRTRRCVFKSRKCAAIALSSRELPAQHQCSGGAGEEQGRQSHVVGPCEPTEPPAPKPKRYSKSGSSSELVRRPLSKSIEPPRRRPDSECLSSGSCGATTRLGKRPKPGARQARQRAALGAAAVAPSMSYKSSGPQRITHGGRQSHRAHVRAALALDPAPSGCAFLRRTTPQRGWFAASVASADVVWSGHEMVPGAAVVVLMRFLGRAPN